MNAEQQKTAIISGGAGGLGMALADQLLDGGWRICLLDLPGERLEQARARFEGRAVELYGCDLTEEAKVAEVCAALRQSTASIDLVVYNAGITQIGELTAEPVAAHHKVFDVNYFGALYLLREMVKPVRRSKGTHLAISSVAGFAPLYHRTAYSASKHALEGLFKSLRAEELAHDVEVAIAAPSFVATNLGNPEHQAGGIARPGSASDGVDYMSPEDAAKEILAGLQRRRTYIPVGRIARIGWRLNRLLPELYFRAMMKRIAQKDK